MHYYILKDVCNLSKKNLIILISSIAAGLILLVALGIWLTGVFKSDGGTKNKGGAPTVSVGSVSAEPGKNIKIPVSFTGNPGAMGFLIDFEYDADALEYLSTDKGELLTDCTAAEAGSGKIKLVSVEDKDVQKDGVLAYLNFKIKNGASGKTEIKVICGENAVCNYDEQAISVKTENGSVTVK